MKTLFLDTDARLISSVEGLFRMFDRFDFAAAHAPVRTPTDGWTRRSHAHSLNSIQVS